MIPLTYRIFNRERNPGFIPNHLALASRVREPQTLVTSTKEVREGSPKPSPAQSGTATETPDTASDDSSGPRFGFEAALAAFGTIYYLLKRNDETAEK